MSVDTFQLLEDFVTRKLRQIDQVQSVRDSLEIAIDSPSGEVREAAAMLYAAGELSKLYKEIRDACQAYLKANLPPGTEATVGQYAINHYTRKVFDKTAWEYWCETDEDMQPLWKSFQDLEEIKKREKGQFQYIDSSVRVRVLEVPNE